MVNQTQAVQEIKAIRNWWAGHVRGQDDNKVSL